MKDTSQFPVGTVQVRDVYDEMHANGVITPDVNREVPVVSLGGGRVVEIKAKLGDYVKKGEVLLLINSPDLTSAYLGLPEVQGRRSAGRKAAGARATALRQGRHRASRSGSRAGRRRQGQSRSASGRRAGACAGRRHQPSHGLLPLRAPISGTIVDQQITGGTGVKSLDNQRALFTIADLSQVWVLATSIRTCCRAFTSATSAEIQRQRIFRPDSFPGTVINISEVLDPTTRAAKVRIRACRIPTA